MNVDIENAALKLLDQNDSNELRKKHSAHDIDRAMAAVLKALLLVDGETYGERQEPHTMIYRALRVPRQYPLGYETMSRLCEFSGTDASFSPIEMISGDIAHLLVDLPPATIHAVLPFCKDVWEAYPQGINAPDAYGMSPLCYACYSIKDPQRLFETVTILLKIGVDPTEKAVGKKIQDLIFDITRDKPSGWSTGVRFLEDTLTTLLFQIHSDRSAGDTDDID
jgi:hypothetical protein